MNRVLASIVLLWAAALPATAAEVGIEMGNVVLRGDDGKPKRLTSSGRDAEPVLTPDGKWVIFTRLAEAANNAEDGCRDKPPFDKLMTIGADGKGEDVILEGRTGAKPPEALCAFSAKQFSPDGQTLYVLTPAWATSAALYAVDLAGKTARFVKDASDVQVLSGCTNPDYRGRLALLQHRYFVFGGSYDWYWLFDPDGKEIGPIGEFDSSDAMRQAIADSGLCEP